MPLLDSDAILAELEAEIQRTIEQRERVITEHAARLSALQDFKAKLLALEAA